MSQKLSKEQMAQMIVELGNRSANVKNMKALQKYISIVSIPGSEAIELGMAINWLNNVIKGEDARCAELKALLPNHDVEIKLGEAPEGPEEPEAPQDPAPPEGMPEPAAATSVGAVEMSKGSEVLQPA